jgi:hypothetical protein
MTNIKLQTLALIACLSCMLVSCNTLAPAQNGPPRAVAAGAVENGNRPATLPDNGVGANMLPEISVEILGPVSSLKGHKWPRGYDWVHEKEDQLVSQTAEDEPHELVMHLPSGRTIRHISKATFFTQKGGVVDLASLMPHPGLLQYQDAIKLLERILQKWDAKPDERTQKLLTTWKAEGDLKPWELAQRGGGADLHGEDKVDINFAIRPSKAGWYLVIDVAATLDQERLLWKLRDPPTSAPASQAR